ncbi:frataxin, mitochondrial-like [Artemia franciscana]|uniref:ferroxidase n=1 Tax=Artemia franciscana TaxID=6661 RepID=A0AA88I9D1_ARTSF|nr:hypothetical protein QYM36_002784 [Artemia franciscana]
MSFQKMYNKLYPLLHQKRIPLVIHQGVRSFTDGEKTYFEDINTYHKIADDTLESLADKLEGILETQTGFDSDISLSNGVLTVQLTPHGTYVINKQTPNRQIWFSSPISGPKRYDFTKNTWIYKHDNSQLHNLLSEELTKALKIPCDLSNCDYGKEDA